MGSHSEHDVEQLRARLNEYMARHGLRSTEQRAPFFSNHLFQLANEQFSLAVIGVKLGCSKALATGGSTTSWEHLRRWTKPKRQTQVCAACARD